MFEDEKQQTDASNFLLLTIVSSMLNRTKSWAATCGPATYFDNSNILRCFLNILLSSQPNFSEKSDCSSPTIIRIFGVFWAVSFSVTD